MGDESAQIRVCAGPDAVTMNSTEKILAGLGGRGGGAVKKVLCGFGALGAIRAGRDMMVIPLVLVGLDRKPSVYQLVNEDF